MLYILIFMVLIFLLVEFWPLFLILVIGFIIFAIVRSSDKTETNNYDYENVKDSKPKIGAEVSNAFHYEVKR